MAYPLLSKTNIVTSNTIQAADVSQRIEAIKGTTNYQIRISGSLTVIGSINYVGPNNTNKGGFTGSLYGTSSYSISSSYGYAYTSSNITSASFAYNSSYTSGSIYGFTVRSSSAFDNHTASLAKVGILSGTSYIRSGETIRTVLFTATPFPSNATLGDNVWITISQFDSRLDPSNWDGYVAVRSITTSSIDFQTRRNNTAPRDLPFTFLCVYEIP